METILKSNQRIKVAVIGSNGYIAKQIIPALQEKDYEIITFSSSPSAENYLNLTELDDYDWSIFEKIEYVLILAAVSSPDQCERNYQETYKINVIGTEKLIQETIKLKCKVIFFSSDAVFGKDMGHAFYEDSERNPISAYGSMKKYIEDQFLEEDFFKVIRLSYVFSDRDKFTKFYLYEITNGVIPEIYHPFYRSVICMIDLIKIIYYILEEWKNIHWNVINACGNELISRVQIADTINRIINRPKSKYKVIEMPNEFENIRPQITEMKSYYIREIINDNTYNFYQKAYRELRKYENGGIELI